MIRDFQITDASQFLSKEQFDFYPPTTHRGPNPMVSAPGKL